MRETVKPKQNKSSINTIITPDTSMILAQSKPSRRYKTKQTTATKEPSKSPQFHTNLYNKTKTNNNNLTGQHEEHTSHTNKQQTIYINILMMLMMIRQYY